MSEFTPAPPLPDTAFRSGSTSPSPPHLSSDSGRWKRLRDHNQYISVTMEFRCNLRCTHCMIEGTMDRLVPTTVDDFDRILRDQAERAPWQGLVLTGSEITLHRDLPNLVRRAKAAGFAHIRIQTHGMQLSRKGYLDTLIDAGVDEFFVSVAGHDANSHDTITQVSGSWDKMIAGFDLLELHEADVCVITNTVVTAQSYRFLPLIVKALQPYRRVVQHEFWNYFPMAETDSKSLIVPYKELMPILRDTINACDNTGRRVEVKNIPECLLGPRRDALVNTQPTLVIDPEFWREFDRNHFYHCPHQNTCSSKECLGLTSAYIGRFGDENDILNPIGSTP